MRIITGTARGRKLKTLEGLDVRPTAEKVKEGIFSAIQFSVEGRRVLDLFAGSGQLALEALSRGARSAVFVDQSSKALAVVRENIANCKFEELSRVVQSDSVRFLKSTSDTFDIAFIDPPYNIENMDEILRETARCMAIGGTIIAETAIDRQLPEQLEGDVTFVIDRVYNYGKTKVTMYRREQH